MTTLASHSRALMILDKVLEEEDYGAERAILYFTTLDRGRNQYDEEVSTELFFFGVNTDIYIVNLHVDGGEVQFLQASDTWAVFPPKEESVEEVMDVDVNE